MSDVQAAGLRADIGKLRQAIADLDGMPEAQAQLFQRLAAMQQQLDELDTTAVATPRTGPQTDTLHAGRDAYLATYQTFNNYGPVGGLDHATLRRHYLQELVGQCNRLSLADAAVTDSAYGAVALAAIYTNLEVASTLASPRADRQKTAIEAATATQRLVLLGEPGSGKSTFLNFLTLCLAQAMLNQDSRVPLLGEGWTRGPLLPVRVALRDLATLVIQQSAPTRPGDSTLLKEYLTAQVGDAVVPLLQTALENGHAVLLLDGLDEVPVATNGVPLQAVVAWLQVLATTYGCPIIVTCRARDYTQEPRRRLPGWKVERLIPFSRTACTTCIDRWYKELSPSMDEAAMAARDRLVAAVTTWPDVQRLAGNPLLLTIMIRLHAEDQYLRTPVRLYAQCIAFLAHHWRPRPDEPPLSAILGLPQWDEHRLEQLLDRLGFAAHTLSNSVDEQGADLPRPVLVETARAFFTPFGAEQDYERAIAFYRYINRHDTGVLQKQGVESYRFPHRVFQEFLAARRLLDTGNTGDWPEGEREFVERVLVRVIAGPQWREAILLAVSQLVATQQPRSAIDLAAELFSRHRLDDATAATLAILAAEVLGTVGHETLTTSSRLHMGLWENVAAVLVRLLVVEGAVGQPLIAVHQRVRAGQALSTLGDPRPGVMTLAPDWCPVPAGPFLLGSTEAERVPGAQAKEQPQRTVDLPAFRISRYPVTNAQWRQFVDAGGYTTRSWWSDAGWQEREAEDWTQPSAWDDGRLVGANLPVGGVSWYEATAYCRWLTQELGYAVWLPSEAQWEKAARGRDGRAYPWGNNSDGAPANTSEAELGTPTPVGCYAVGASPVGALDMSGNVWEWTATPYKSTYAAHDGTAVDREDGQIVEAAEDKLRSRRGGSWASGLFAAMCAARDWDEPVRRESLLGMRVATAGDEL